MLSMLMAAMLASPTNVHNVTLSRIMPNTNFPSGDLPGKDHQFPAGLMATACQALCDKTPECHAWTFLKRGPDNQMACCIKGPIKSDGCPEPAKGMTSGAKVAGVETCTPPPGPKPPPPPGPPYPHTGPLTCQSNTMFPMLPTFTSSVT